MSIEDLATAIKPASQSNPLAGLALQPADSLLALIGMFRADTRGEKIDLGVGIYKDEFGQTPVMAAVKMAESILFAGQTTKSYLGPEGDVRFFEELASLVLGDLRLGGRLSGLQTPGGTGAIRLAAELIARSTPHARVHVGMPTWPNHIPLLEAAGLTIVPHRFFDVTSQALDFMAILDALESSRPGDVVLLHGCCHNPTGADFTLEQWIALAEVISRRELFPLFDLAYQGLGDGFEDDATGMKLVCNAVPASLIAYSCDKNFGMYRERVGALFAISSSDSETRIVQSNLLSLARVNWSMPPDHGAATVRTVLETPELRTIWGYELNAMRERLSSIRKSAGAADGRLAFLATQKGMFSTLNLSSAQILTLREKFGIYMAGSGRISIAGLTGTTVERFVAALASVR